MAKFEVWKAKIQKCMSLLKFNILYWTLFEKVSYCHLFRQKYRALTLEYFLT